MSLFLLPVLQKVTVSYSVRRSASYPSSKTAIHQTTFPFVWLNRVIIPTPFSYCRLTMSPFGESPTMSLSNTSFFILLSVNHNKIATKMPLSTLRYHHFHVHNLICNKKVICAKKETQDGSGSRTHPSCISFLCVALLCRRF